jgi:lipopolysaccharide heptosyltransferase II
MKCLDNLLGKLAVQLILAPRRPLSNPVPRKILIIRPGGIGDAVLLIPVIRILKNTFPEMDITILAEKRNSAVFSFCPEITGVISYDSPKDLLAAVRGKFDAVIDTEQWHCLSAVMARLVRSSLKIGYGTNMRRKLFTHMIDYSHNDYEINSFLNLLSPLGVVQPKVPEYPFIHIPANIAHSVTAMLKPLSGRDFVTLFPGASTVEKRWDEGKFIALSKNLSEKGIVVVIVGSDSEKLIGEKIIASGCGLNLAGRTSLIESAAVIQRSSLLISGDSGLLHIAVGLGVPTVSLFGPSNTSKWAPKGARHIIVSGNLPCSPCSKFGYTPQCPINVKCMADIAEEEVVAAVEKLLGKFQIGSAHDSI